MRNLPRYLWELVNFQDSEEIAVPILVSRLAPASRCFSAGRRVVGWADAQQSRPVLRFLVCVLPPCSLGAHIVA